MWREGESDSGPQDQSGEEEQPPGTIGRPPREEAPEDAGDARNFSRERKGNHASEANQASADQAKKGVVVHGGILLRAGCAAQPVARVRCAFGAGQADGCPARGEVTFETAPKQVARLTVGEPALSLRTRQKHRLRPPFRYLVMNAEMLPSESQQKPLRMWPALVLMALIVLCRYVPGFIEGASSQVWYVPVFFPLLASVLMLIWWLAGSRATGREKLIGFFGFIAALAVIVVLSHPTMRGLITTYLTLPSGMIGFGLGAYFNRGKPSKPRVTGVLLGAVLAMSITLLLQSYGITGAYAFELHSRWSPAPGAGSWTKSAPSKAQSAGANIEAAIATAEWPGFRGADRMGHTKAPKLATDWKAKSAKVALEKNRRRWLVVVRGRGSICLHAGATRAERSRGLLRGRHGQRSLDAAARGSLRRADGRPRSARHTDAGGWRGLRHGRVGNVAALEGEHGRSGVAAGLQESQRPRGASHVGLRGIATGDEFTGHHLRRRSGRQRGHGLRRRERTTQVVGSLRSRVV